MDDKIILATYDALAQAHSFNIYSDGNMIILCIHMPPDRIVDWGLSKDNRDATPGYFARKVVCLHLVVGRTDSLFFRYTCVQRHVD